MTIEFECSNCGKQLSTPDDKAGKTGKCPDCGSPVTVPQKGSGFEADDPFNIGELAATLPPLSGSRAQRSCPMCGAAVSATDATCPSCGEDLEREAIAQAGEITTGHTVDIGEVFSVSWNRYQEQMGIAIAGMLVMGFCAGGFNALMQVIAEALDDPILGMVVVQIASLLFNTWLRLGLFMFLLSIARGEKADIARIFAGGKYFFRGLLIVILYGLIMLVGVGPPAALCFWLGMRGDLEAAAFILAIPTAIWAIYLGLSFLWSMYVLVDTDTDSISCMKTSWEMMTGNYLAVFVLNLLVGILVFVGFLMCCVGAIFTAPLAMILQAVTYVHLTGGARRRPGDVY